MLCDLYIDKIITLKISLEKLLTSCKFRARSVCGVPTQQDMSCRHL